MASSLHAVVSQMLALGMPPIAPSELHLDTDRFQRYGPKKKAYYKIARRVARSGREYFVGAFGYKGDGPHTIAFEGEALTPAQIAELERKRARAAQLEARRREISIQRAADRAAQTWAQASPKGSSVYLQRKGVTIDGGWVRYLDGLVVVPMVRYDLGDSDRLKGVQLIRPDGEKRFTGGMAKLGCAAVLGRHHPGAPMLVCEGLATAATVWQALDRDLRVVVAFDAGNLIHVAEIFRELDPKAPLGFCADDDFRTPGEPGYVKAQRAARKVGRAQALRPHFAARGDRKLTDFNDLQAVEGVAVVRAQLGRYRRFLEAL